QQAATPKPAPACPKFDPSKNQEVAVRAEDTALLFDGRIRLRLHTITTLGATFYSNIPSIELGLYIEGSEQRFVIDNCTYVLKVLRIFNPFSVTVTFFQV